ncbi:MAG: peroxiredoxin [Saprospiraceae bacterium]|nr:peroxiredoxin [Saprospiraceae bacterium]
MALKIGEASPDFSLKSTDNTELSLSNFSGKNLVILFFPKAFTGVCTAELCGVRDNMSTYNDLNAEVVAVSVDTTDTLDKFKEEQNFNFTLLSDSNKEVATKFGALYDDMEHKMFGLAKRSAFVVDKNGIIRYAEVLENAGELPNFAAINETLSQLN